jgi:hypothetical protein
MSLDEEVDEAASAFARLTADLDAQVDRFVEAVIPVVVSWLNEAVERAVVSQPEKAKALGREGLGGIKRELRDITMRLPDDLRRHLGREYSWPHRQMSGGAYTDSDNPYRGSSLAIIIDAVREPTHEVGSLLERADLMTSGGAKGEWHQSGGNRDPTQWESNRSLDIGADARRVLEEMADGFRELHNAQVRLNNLRNAKAAAEAKKLWDEA